MPAFGNRSNISQVSTASGIFMPRIRSRSSELSKINSFREKLSKIPASLRYRGAASANCLPLAASLRWSQDWPSISARGSLDTFRLAQWRRQMTCRSAARKSLLIPRNRSLAFFCTRHLGSMWPIAGCARTPRVLFFIMLAQTGLTAPATEERFP